MTATVEPTIVTLSRAQYRVMTDFLTDGASNDTLAARLGLSFHTVKSHIKDAMKAMGVTTRTEAVAEVLHGRIKLVEGAAMGWRPINAPGAVHLAPRPGSVLLATGCCHRLVETLRTDDSLTRAPERVTCDGC